MIQKLVIRVSQSPANEIVEEGVVFSNTTPSSTTHSQELSLHSNDQFLSPFRYRWISWNRHGLFPAPHQSEADFLIKVRTIEQLHPDLAQQACQNPLHLNPKWMSIQYQRKGLSFWEGGALWQEEIAPGVSLPHIQIASPKGSAEILNHEMVHAARVDFPSGPFEEVLAYATSSHAWRRYWGPFFRTPRETGIFIFCLGALVIYQWVDLLFDGGHTWPFFVGLSSLFLLGFWRLQRTHRQYRACFKNLENTLENPKLTPAYMIRLSDEEIRLFASLSPLQIAQHMEQQDSFRWKILKAAYATKRGT